jgi:hypothetical protein
VRDPPPGAPAISEQLITVVDRQSLLDALGQPRDLTLVRGPAREPDDPALAPVHGVLADHIYREVAFEQLCEVTGDVVVLDGGPGFTHATAHLMARALAVAELRFDRVVVLPTSIDQSCDTVRETIAGSRATFIGARVTAGRDPAANRAQPTGAPALPTARVTAVILSRAQPDAALRAADSVRAAAVDTAVLVLDNNSRDADAAVLAAGVRARDRVWLHRSDRNLGTGGGRCFGVAHSTGEYVLFLDDDAVLAPGALEALLAEIDRHPDVSAVTASVVGADGRVQHSGGWVEVAGGVAEFTALGQGDRLENLPPSGPIGWVRVPRCSPGATCSTGSRSTRGSRPTTRTTSGATGSRSNVRAASGARARRSSFTTG